MSRYRHVRQRIRERAGLTLSADDCRWVDAMIWAGAAEWTADLPGPKQAYRMHWWNERGCTAFVVVFDIRLGVSVTAFGDVEFSERGTVSMRGPATATLAEIAGMGFSVAEEKDDGACEERAGRPVPRRQPRHGGRRQPAALTAGRLHRP